MCRIDGKQILKGLNSTQGLDCSPLRRGARSRWETLFRQVPAEEGSNEPKVRGTVEWSI